MSSGWSRAGVPGRFALVRLKRLWPLYALGLAVGLGFYIAVRIVKPSDNFLFPAMPVASVAVMGLLFLPQWMRFGGGAAFPLNPACWSLSVEFFGNLAYAAVARSLSNRTLMFVIAVGAAGVAVAAFKSGDLDVGAGIRETVFAYMRFAFSFPCGVLLYRLHRDGKLPRLGVPPWLVLAGVALTFSSLTQPGPFYDTLVAIAIYPLLLTAAVSREPVGRAAAVFAWCGAISYPLYVLHQPAANFIIMVVPPGPLRLALVLCMPPLFIGLAALAVRWFDRPLQTWLAAATATKRVSLVS